MSRIAKMVLIIVSAATFTGCAGSVKKQIASDLNAILQVQDCPTACDAVKAYVKGQLGQ